MFLTCISPKIPLSGLYSPVAVSVSISSALFSISLMESGKLAKGKCENGYLNMGGNADIITFDFSAYNSTITAVTFDVTIPNWTSEKNDPVGPLAFKPPYREFASV